MTESELYQKHLKSFFKQRGIFCYRVEHRRLPDVYLSRGNYVLWAELKCVNKKSKIVKPDWRPGQLAWIKENHFHGSFNVCLILWYVDKILYLPPQKEYTQEELKCQKNIYLKTMLLM